MFKNCREYDNRFNCTVVPPTPHLAPLAVVESKRKCIKGHASLL